MFRNLVLILFSLSLTLLIVNGALWGIESFNGVAGDSAKKEFDFSHTLFDEMKASEEWGWLDDSVVRRLERQSLNHYKMTRNHPVLVEEKPKGGARFQSRSQFPKSSFLVKHRKWTEDGELFDIEYNYDDFWRRRVPENPRSAEKFLIVAGGSFVFGEGLEDTETLANQLVLKLNEQKPGEFRGYILAERGYGPNDLLDELTYPELDRLAGVSEDSGYLIYWPIDHHFNRLVGPSRRVLAKNDWMMDKTKYQLVDGQLVKGLPFRDYFWENLLFRFLHWNHFSQFFHIEIPARFGKPHKELFARVLDAMVQEVEKRKGPTRLIVVNGFGSKTMDSEFQQVLRSVRADVIFFDYRDVDFFALTRGHPRIWGDGHPSVQFNSVFSQLIARDLRKLERAE